MTVQRLSSFGVGGLMVTKMSNTTRLLSTFRNVLTRSEIRTKCEQPRPVDHRAEMGAVSDAAIQRKEWLKAELDRDLRIATGIAMVYRASFFR